MCKISSRYLQKWLRYYIKHVKKSLFTSFRDFTVISRIFFFGRFWRWKRCLRVIFSRSLRKSDLKSCIAALNHEILLFDLFSLGNWDDLDLYYGHRAQELLLKNVSDTIHADSLALFALTIEILHADVTKPEMSNILIWTWPVTSLVTPRSWKFVFFRQFFQGFQMPLVFLESVQ